MQLGQACATCENASKFSSNQTAAEAPVDKKLELRKKLQLKAPTSYEMLI